MCYFHNIIKIRCLLAYPNNIELLSQQLCVTSGIKWKVTVIDFKYHLRRVSYVEFLLEFSCLFITLKV
jgi:hypothetical protein